MLTCDALVVEVVGVIEDVHVDGVERFAADRRAVAQDVWRRVVGHAQRLAAVEQRVLGVQHARLAAEARVELARVLSPCARLARVVGLAEAGERAESGARARAAVGARMRLTRVERAAHRI